MFFEWGGEVAVMNLSVAFSLRSAQPGRPGALRTAHGTRAFDQARASWRTGAALVFAGHALHPVASA